MIRSLIGSTITSIAMTLLSFSPSFAQTPAEAKGNRMERKGHAEEKAANAEKAKGDRIEKSGKALQKDGDKKGNKAEEESGNRLEGNK